jgi:hypothetical protein
MKMRGREKASVLICLLCLMLVFLFGVAAPAALSETLQLPGQGETASGGFFRDKFACVRWVEKKAQDSKCLECHGTIVKAELPAVAERDGSPSRVKMIHVQHMGSERVNFTCITCHERIDPYETSSVGLRTQVPANMCFKCHFPHGQE